MRVLLHNVTESLATALISRIRAGDRLSPIAVSVRNEEPRSRERLRSYPEPMDDLLKKYVTDPAIAENEAAVPRNV